jgi:flagellar biosynthetic protein FliR
MTDGERVAMINLDFGFRPLETEFWRLVFVMTRIGAALVAAPLFGAAGVPAQARVMLAGAVAVLVCAWTPVQAPAQLLSAAGVLAVLGEVLVGLTLGFVLQLSFAAPVIAAEVIGGGMGLNMAVAIDPVAGTQSPALGQYFTVVLTLVFLALGGHLHWFALLVRSYEVFPPGQTWLGADRFALVAGFASRMLLTAVAIALPVTLVLLVVQLVTGVLGRSAPALNLFSLGMPAGVLGGIAALMIAAPVLTDMVTRLSAEALAQVAEVLGP